MSDMKGFTRDKDGVLVWNSGIGARYNDPKEAVRFYWAGQLRVGCTERIGTVLSSGPCGKTAKHDPDARGHLTKCGLHSKAAYDRRNAKKDATEARWKQQWKADSDLRDAQKALEPALQQIAKGHNNPRELAFDALERLYDARMAVKTAYAKP